VSFSREGQDKSFKIFHFFFSMTQTVKLGNNGILQLQVKQFLFSLFFMIYPLFPSSTVYNQKLGESARMAAEGQEDNF